MLILYFHNLKIFSFFVSTTRRRSDQIFDFYFSIFFSTGNKFLYFNFSVIFVFFVIFWKNNMPQNGINFRFFHFVIFLLPTSI